MAQCVLTWTPGAGTNSLNQLIQYKLDTGTTWIDFNTVGPTVATATITGILDNRIYDFRIIDNCSAGGPTASQIIKGVKLLCPTITPTVGYDTLQYSFTHGGGDISKHVVELLNASNAIVASKPHTNASGTISDIFTGLTPDTDYSVRVVVFAGASNEYSKTCTATTFKTTPAPTCNVPTAVVATLS